METSERGREPLLLPAIACLLLVGAGVLLVTSPGKSVTRPAKDTEARRLTRRWRSQEPPERIAVAAAEEEQGEPLWLLGITSFFVVGIGLLLLFYTDLPISALV